MNVIGHSRIVSSLTSACRKGHLPPLLFHGPFGVGKATTALYLSAECNPPEQRKAIYTLNHPDILVVSYTRPESYGPRPEDFDRTRSISIDAIRLVKEELSRAPVEAERRFVILMDADMMTDEAQNAFLKILEEHDERTTFILIASNYYRLFPTIRSRTLPVAFGGLTFDEFKSYEYEWKHDPRRLYNLSRGSIGLAKQLDGKPLDLWARYLSSMFENPSVQTIAALYSTIENGKDLLLFLIPFRIAVMKKYKETGELVYRYMFENSSLIEEMIFKHSSVEVMLHLLFEPLFQFKPAI